MFPPKIQTADGTLERPAIENRCDGGMRIATIDDEETFHRQLIETLSLGLWLILKERVQIVIGIQG
jgi:hypothetical protein